jgi:putative peptidoglycan lipid II flippase
MSIAKSSFIFGAGTLLSRISGIARESVIGAVFGASLAMDAFVVAFRIPNLLRELLAEGALGSSFTKVYSSLSVNNAAAANKLLIQTIQFVVMVSIAICGLGILFADNLVQLMTLLDGTSSGSAQFQDMTTALTKILFPFIGFISVGAIVQGALYQRGGFFLAGVAPILFNVFSIIGALWLAPFASMITPTSVSVSISDPAILGLAVGTLLGGAAQAGIQAWGLWKPLIQGNSIFSAGAFPWSSDLKKVLWLMAPMVIAGSSGQVNTIVNTNFATSLGEGAVTWLYFAFRLVQLPIGMFGVAIGAAVLPALSKSITEANGKVSPKASQEIINAMDLVAWLLVPCTLGLMLSSVDITRLLYEGGRFSTEDTEATARAIEAYSYGLLGYGVLKVMNSYYYATGRTRFPMVVGLLSIAINYALNSVLVKKVGHDGLALTASIVLTLNATLLVLGMTKDQVTVNWQQVWTSLSLLTIGSGCVLALHKLYDPMVGSASFGRWLLPSQGLIYLKIDAAIRVGIDAILIGTIFATIGLLRIKKTPREALQLLRRRKSTG